MSKLKYKGNGNGVPRGGRYVAYHNEQSNRWEVRIIDRRGRFSSPAALIPLHSSYTDARRTIRILEESIWNEQN